MQGEKESLTLLYYPPEEPGQEPVTLIELGPSTNACPQGLCMYNINGKCTVELKSISILLSIIFLSHGSFDMQTYKKCKRRSGICRE